MVRLSDLVLLPALRSFVVAMVAEAEAAPPAVGVTLIARFATSLGAIAVVRVHTMGPVPAHVKPLPPLLAGMPVTPPVKVTVTVVLDVVAPSPTFCAWTVQLLLIPTMKAVLCVTLTIAASGALATLMVLLVVLLPGL